MVSLEVGGGGTDWPLGQRRRSQPCRSGLWLNQTAHPPRRFRSVGLGGAEACRSQVIRVLRLKTAGRLGFGSRGCRCLVSISCGLWKVAGHVSSSAQWEWNQANRKRTHRHACTHSTPTHVCALLGALHTGHSPRGAGSSVHTPALPAPSAVPEEGQPLSPVPISWGRGIVVTRPSACRTGRVLVPVPLSRGECGLGPLREIRARTSPGQGPLPALPRASLASPGSQGSGPASACT